MSEKTLHNSDASGAKGNVADLNIIGDGDMFKLLCKASSQAEGYQLLAADYSQIELRIMAHLSGDTGLLDAFKAGKDIHSATAAEIFGIALEDVETHQRRSAKAINFGLI